MLYPVLLPLPVALAILGLLAYAALRPGAAWPTLPARPPKHRLDAARQPYRPRPAPEPIEYHPLDPRVPLAEVERRMAYPGAVIIAGLDTWNADTHDLAVAR